MKVKKTIKRILAVGAGLTMLGMTVTGAMAADLKNYPDMFVSDGVFDGLLVVGENAAAVDNLALTDIASSMKYAKAGTSAAVSVEGDAWMVGTSSKKLEMANSNTTSSAITGEVVREISTFIGDDELSGLADGTFATNANSYPYQQFMFFDDNGASLAEDSSLVKYDENDDDLSADYFFVKSGRQIARYKLEFGSTAQSDVTDADGAATTTGDYLDDFRNTELVLFGQLYSIVEATRPHANDQRSVKLTLMAGASRDTLLEGEAGTYMVKGKEYEVSLSYVDATKAKFTVNGETTNKLAVGETYVLADGSEIGVSEVLYQAYAGGVHSAEFYVGAQKLELRDDNITLSNAGSYAMKVGSEDIDGTDVLITGTDDNTVATLSTIEVNMTAEDDYWVGSGAKLSEVIAATGEEKEVLFGNAFDIEYKGLTSEPTHALELKKSSDRRYQMRLYDGDSNPVDIPIAYAEAAFNISFGEETQAAATSRTDWKKLHLVELNTTAGSESGDPIEKKDYFVLTGGTSTDGSAKSYLVQYVGADKSSKTSPKIKFKNVGSGETLEYSVSTTNATATIKLGGYSFLVNGIGITADDFPLLVDLDGSGAIAASADVDFVDSYGSSWNFTKITHNISEPGVTVVVKMTTPNGDDYDNVVPASPRFNLTAVAGPEVRASKFAPGTNSGGGLTLLTPDGLTEVAYGYSSMGTYITEKTPSGSPQEYTLDYPEKQRLPQVFVTSGATTSSVKSGASLAAVTIVDATKLDSEVASVSAQNLIVVGGPCVNTVAAELLGSPADCTEGFTPGKARVKLFEHANGNVAMLVAGYSGADTRLAGKVVANRWQELSGSEVEVEGTTYSDATISAPSAKAMTQ